jgi:hypothetical protein
MEVTMKKAALVASVVLVSAAASALPAVAAPRGHAASTAGPKKQKVLAGFYSNRTISYLDFGRIRLGAGIKISRIWVFANGPDGQRSIVDSVPSNKRYSALRRVATVTWTTDATPRVLRSVTAVEAAESSGDVRITRTSRVVNAPVLGFGQTRHAGFAKGKVIHYYELGVVKAAPGNEVLPIWTFTNGVDGQRNIADVVPGTTAYPPLWGVVEVTWKTGTQGRLIRSFEQLQQARRAGDVTLKQTSTIVNCPFV